MNIKQRLDNINKKINELNTSGLQVVLDMITNLDNRELYYKIKLLDRHNNIIQEEEIHDIPREYIEKYTKRYNITPRLDLYNITNGKLEYIPTILEREKIQNDTTKI